MALQVDYTTIHGFSCPTSYFMVDNFSYNKSVNNEVIASIAIYKDIDSRQNNGPMVGRESVVFALDLESTSNVIQQVYEQLKIKYPAGIDV